MKIQTTLQEISQSGNWELYCDESGTSYWACAEGFGHVSVTLSKDEAIRYGLLEDTDER